MATVQITVTADEDTLRHAERVAASRQTTVAMMLAEALHLIKDMDFDPDTLPPMTRKALGLAHNVPNRPLKELLAEALAHRYRGNE